MTQTQMKPGPRFTVHDRCRKARETAGFEQVELAERLEVARQTISNYETGKVTNLHRGTMRRWALACGVTYEWLRDGDSPGGTRPGGEQIGGTSDQQEDSFRCKAA